jgi:hypothetical protein
VKRKNLWVRLLAVSVLLAAVVSGTFAATVEEIEQAITDGVAWLAGAQEADGRWDGGWGEAAAETCFALVKLQ